MKEKPVRTTCVRWMSLMLGDNKEQRGLMLFFLVLLVSCLVLVLSTGEDWARAISDRVEAGKSIKLVHYMHAGWWWSAAVDGTLLTVLLLSRKLWYFESEKPTLRATSGADRWRWYAWILLILIAAIFVRGPRMDLSLYNDEADVFVRYIGGSFKGAARDLKTETLPDYDQVSWATTFWGNQQGNNHIFYSVLERFCFALDQRLAGRTAGEINEWPLRLPALVGGLLSIFMVAVLLKRLTRPEAGIFAAALLAMHPWHLRFSTEARGYSLMFALMLVAIYCLVRALQEKQWKWWLAYGLLQCCYLYTCLAGVYHAVAINAVVVICWLLGEILQGDGISRVKSLRSWDWRSFKGLVVANVVSLFFFLLLMGPSIPQIARVTKSIGIFKMGMPTGLWPDVASYLAFGMSWFDGDAENLMNPAMEKWFPSAWMILAMVLVGVLLVVGVRAWWKLGLPGRVIFFGAVGSVLLVFGINSLTGGTVLPWYLVYLTPVVVMTLALGLADLLRFRAKLGGGKVVLRNRIILYGAFAIYAMVVMKPIQRYRSIGKQAMRNAVQVARGGTYPFTAQQRRVITAGWWTNADIYDPYLKVAFNKAQLGYLMDKADQEKRPLYFILGNYPNAIAEDASMIDLLEKSGEFETVQVFPGLETYQYREFVFRYLGAERR